MPNRLSHELSPYLLAHADNPVDWQPWDAQSLETAAREQKPIFLSIGYSACHWCHEMAHDSFQDAEIARLLSENYVSIKVDREERPDLDQIYMEAVQLMTGRGGWPMSVFLTPELKPFYGGTYWPSHRREGMPGFDEVLNAVSDAWKGHRSDVLQQAERVTRALHSDPWQGATGALSEQPIEAAEKALAESFDSRHGGFGPAPKFPQPMLLSLLLQRWRLTGRDALLDMVNVTLEHMALGGIYDQLGGGFHRYSVDARWLVPHFETMLYDNALLAGCYLDAWQATGKPLYGRVVRETLDYVLRDMTAAEGGFYCAEDADSEGVEGKFYLWTPEEIASVLGAERAKTFCHVYDVTATGNFEGRNILHLANPISLAAKMLDRDADELEATLAEDRRLLLAARSQRVRPLRDDKVLTNWNGLMIEILTRAGAALNEPRYGQAAARAAEFLLSSLRDNRSRLLHCWRNGSARHSAYLDDYASLANALVTLGQHQPEGPWLDEAIRLTDRIVQQFHDPRLGGFFFTAEDHEPLIVRKKDVIDNSLPSSNGLTVTVLLRLAELGRGDQYRRLAEDTLRSSMGIVQQIPLSAGQLLMALQRCLG